MEFWFDDGVKEDYTKTYPFLAAYGCTKIAAILTDMVGRPGYMDLDMLKELIAHGWKIASHGTDHTCFLRLNVCDTERVLCNSCHWIKDNLGVEPYAFVAPWNIISPGQRDVALRYYKFVRDAKTLHFHSANFADVKNTITKILQGGPEVYQMIEHERYLASRKYVASTFGFNI